MPEADTGRIVDLSHHSPENGQNLFVSGSYSDGLLAIIANAGLIGLALVALAWEIAYHPDLQRGFNGSSYPVFLLYTFTAALALAGCINIAAMEQTKTETNRQRS